LTSKLPSIIYVSTMIYNYRCIIRILYQVGSKQMFNIYIYDYCIWTTGQSHFFFVKPMVLLVVKQHIHTHPIPMAEAQEPQKVNTLRISGGEKSRIPKKGSQESWKILQT
jgi:hypothetical protein